MVRSAGAGGPRRRWDVCSTSQQGRWMMNTYPGGFYALTSKRRDEVLALADKLGAFDVIYADFPWQFKTHSKKGMGRAAERHYDTMTLEEIGNYPIASFAAP